MMESLELILLFIVVAVNSIRYMHLFAALLSVVAAPTAVWATTVISFENANHLFIHGPYAESGFSFSVPLASEGAFRVSQGRLTTSCACTGDNAIIPHEIRISSEQPFNLLDIDFSRAKSVWTLKASSGSEVTFGEEVIVPPGVGQSGILSFTGLDGWKKLSYVDVYNTSGEYRGFDFESITVQSVPEPAGLILIGGIALCASIRRRDRNGLLARRQCEAL